MRLKVAILGFVLAIGMAAAASVIVAPTSVAAEPKKPDCVGC
jgi:hypothetical protein